MRGLNPRVKKKGHDPHFPYSGAKGSLLEGGHRVPFIVQCNEKVNAGSQCDALVCLSDVMETFADYFSVDLPDNAAEDSVSFLPALYGKEVEDPRVDIVHHDWDGHFAIRQGDWKLILKKEKHVKNPKVNTQLYNLKEDLAEKENLSIEKPEKVAELLTLLESYIEQGRSTTGEPQQNDAENIDIWKHTPAKAMKQ